VRVLDGGRSTCRAGRWPRAVALIAAFAWLAGAEPAGAVFFSATTNHAVGHHPYSVAVGDFNVDGRPDLATANYDSYDVSLLLGDGSGSFSGATNYPAGRPVSVAVGDFNGDDRPDLATANLTTDSVSVLLGDGAGGFGAATNFAAGNAPRSVAVGDFDGDSQPDLATANQLGNNVSVLRGDGSGGFGARTSYPAGNTPRSVAVGDLNRDGRLDLATANSNGNDVSVLLGDGAGGFGAPANFPVGSSPYPVAVGDLNGDGRPDLATANQSSDNVSVLLGDGSGSFSGPTNYPAGRLAGGVAVGDLDADGRPDLATANQFSADVSVLLGDGSGGFGAPAKFAAGTTPSWLTIGDFDGDDRPDLATANVNSDNVSVLLNRTELAAPTVTIATPADGAQIARGASVLAHYTCVDEPGGSGIASCTGTVAADQPLDTSTLGPKTFTVTASDRAGNTATRTVGYVVVDVTAPTIDAVSPGPDTDYEAGAMILAEYSCADEPGGSGTAACTGTVPSGQPIDTSLGAHVFTISAEDNAGNLASTTISYTASDRVAPEISISSPMGSYRLLRAILSPPRAVFACIDDVGGSGLATCTATADGRPVHHGGSVPVGLGNHTFTVTATDRAGNTRTQTTTYTITLL